VAKAAESTQKFPGAIVHKYIDSRIAKTEAGAVTCFINYISAELKKI
jgi:hypothetical protein